jgi:hypothetical protein
VLSSSRSSLRVAQRAKGGSRDLLRLSPLVRLQRRRFF